MQAVSLTFDVGATFKGQCHDITNTLVFFRLEVTDKDTHKPLPLSPSNICLFYKGDKVQDVRQFL